MGAEREPVHSWPGLAEKKVQHARRWCGMSARFNFLQSATLTRFTKHCVTLDCDAIK